MAVRIQAEPFDAAAEAAALTRGRTDIGAVVTFTGICRGTDGGDAVSAMTLEHYPGMAEAEIERHVAAAERRWPLKGVTVIHRHGRLVPGDLIVLATPVEMASNHGFLTPQFQLGAKETWYDVKLTVDSVLKGKLKSAKRPDLGMLPAVYTPPPSFGKLAPNEIVVQYPAVTSRASDWAAAAPLVPGERAIFIFRRCYYCLPISGVAHGRGPYYKANPLVAMGRASKLPPTEWERVVRIAKRRQR